MFLCHFPSSATGESIAEAWALPSTLSDGARTFLPPDYSGRRSPGLLNPLNGTLAYRDRGVKATVGVVRATAPQAGPKPRMRLINLPLGMEAWYTPGSGFPLGTGVRHGQVVLAFATLCGGEEVIGCRPTTQNLQLLAGVRSLLDQRDGCTSWSRVVWDNPLPLVEARRRGRPSPTGLRYAFGHTSQNLCSHKGVVL